jgi:hypothetical protein
VSDQQDGRPLPAAEVTIAQQGVNALTGIGIQCGGWLVK